VSVPPLHWGLDDLLDVQYLAFKLIAEFVELAGLNLVLSDPLDDLHIVPVFIEHVLVDAAGC